MIRGVILDADGTLLDSMSVWQDLGSRLLARHGIEAPEGLSPILEPMTPVDSARYLHRTFGIGDCPQAVEAEMRSLIREEYRSRVPAKPGAVAFVKRLKKAQIPLALATSCDRELLLVCLARLGIQDCFASILFCAELQTDKRSTFIYEKAAESLGLAPEECLVFEDAPYALASAIAAGCRTVRILEESYREEDFPEGIDWTLNDFTSTELLPPFLFEPNRKEGIQ